MVLIRKFDKVHMQSMRYDFNLAWLYDLSSRKWRDLELPPLPLGRRRYNEQHTEFTVTSPDGQTREYHDSTSFVDVMCDLKWSA